MITFKCYVIWTKLTGLEMELLKATLHYTMHSIFIPHPTFTVRTKYLISSQYHCSTILPKNQFTLIVIYIVNIGQFKRNKLSNAITPEIQWIISLSLLVIVCVVFIVALIFFIAASGIWRELRFFLKKHCVVVSHVVRYINERSITEKFSSIIFGDNKM